MSHARDFGQESEDEATAQQLALDYREANLTDADRALCDYAIKLTLDPGGVQDRDVHQLRDFGFTDSQITVATQVIGYFNYINRVAQGLGVDPEPWMDLLPERAWRIAKGTDYLDRL